MDSIRDKLQRTVRRARRALRKRSSGRARRLADWLAAQPHRVGAWFVVAGEKVSHTRPVRILAGLGRGLGRACWNSVLARAARRRVDWFRRLPGRVDEWLDPARAEAQRSWLWRTVSGAKTAAGWVAHKLTKLVRPGLRLLSRHWRLTVCLGLAVAVWYVHRVQLPLRAAAFYQEAQAALRSGQGDRAVRNLEACLSLAPERLDAYELLAETQRQSGQTAEGSALLDRMVAGHPQQARAYVLRGRYRAVTGRTADANADSEAALRLAPEDREVLEFALERAIRDRRHADARRQAEILQQFFPHSVALSRDLAELEIGEGRPAQAVAWLVRAVHDDPRDAASLNKLGHLVCDLGRPREAASLVAPLAKCQPDWAAFLQARIHYLEGRWQAAAQGFLASRATVRTRSGPVGQLDFWLGDCYGHMGYTPLQLTAWRQAAEAAPHARAPRESCLGLLLTLERFAEADELLREMRKNCPDQRSDDRWQARLLVHRALRSPPSWSDWQTVHQALAKTTVDYPDAFEPRLLQVDLLCFQGRLDLAEQGLTRLQEEFPLRSEPWLALAALAQRRGDSTAADESLADARKHFGDSVALRLTQAAVWLWRSGPDASPPIRELARQVATLPAAELPALWQGLAVVLLRAGDSVEAAALCQKALEQNPLNTGGWLLAFQIALRRRDPQLADVALSQIQASVGQGPYWHYGQALKVFLSPGNEGQARFAHARSRLAAASPVSQSWPGAAWLAAEIERAAGRETLAASWYSTAAVQADDDPQQVLQVLAYLSQCQRYAEADRLVRQLTARRVARLTGVYGDEGHLSLALGDFAGFIPAAQRVAQMSRNGDQLPLATVLELAAAQAAAEGSPSRAADWRAQAAAVLEQAAAAQDSRADACLAQIGFLCRTGRTEDLAGPLANARQKLAAAPLILAQALELAGDLAEAEKWWRKALGAAATEAGWQRCAEWYARARGEQAWEDQLEGLASGQLEVSDATQAWARRRWAWLAVSRRESAARQSALAWIEQNLAGKLGSPEDKRLRLLLLAFGKQHAFRRQAIQVIEEKLDRADGAVPPEEDRLLAALALAENDWPKARKRYRHLLSEHPGEPGYLTAWTNALLQRNELEEAEIHLRGLRQVAPASFSTVALDAELLFRRGRPEEASRRLQDFSQQLDGEPRDPALRAELVAATLQELARRLSQSGRRPLAEPCLVQAETLRRVWNRGRPSPAWPWPDCWRRWGVGTRRSKSSNAVARAAERQPWPRPPRPCRPWNCPRPSGRAWKQPSTQAWLAWTERPNCYWFEPCCTRRPGGTPSRRRCCEKCSQRTPTRWRR